MNARPRILDLFCGAGGAAVGYYRAGFDVVGVDCAPQPRYPFAFHQQDAMQTCGMDAFDAIHASPPCQFYSTMTQCRPRLSGMYPDLIGQLRDLLDRVGKPYIIENVEGAPLATHPTLDGRYGVTLCGTMFGLDLYRHRVFETNWPIAEPHHPQHTVPASPAGHWEPGTVMSVAGHVSPIEEAERAMGIDWMRRDELAEAIPPAYTEHIGAALIRHLASAVVS